MSIYLKPRPATGGIKEQCLKIVLCPENFVSHVIKTKSCPSKMYFASQTLKCDYGPA